MNEGAAGRFAGLGSTQAGLSRAVEVERRGATHLANLVSDGLTRLESSFNSLSHKLEPILTQSEITTGLEQKSPVGPSLNSPLNCELINIAERVKLICDRVEVTIKMIEL